MRESSRGCFDEYEGRYLWLRGKGPGCRICKPELRAESQFWPGGGDEHEPLVGSFVSGPQPGKPGLPSHTRP